MWKWDLFWIYSCIEVYSLVKQYESGVQPMKTSRQEVLQGGGSSLIQRFGTIQSFGAALW